MASLLPFHLSPPTTPPLHSHFLHTPSPFSRFCGGGLQCFLLLTRVPGVGCAGYVAMVTVTSIPSGYRGHALLHKEAEVPGKPGVQLQGEPKGELCV